MSSFFDVIVVGGGAAGLMCAVTAGKRQKKVLVLDSANKVGKKILISGGGRCNFTNIYTGPANYLSNNPHFCKSALSRFTPADFIKLVEESAIPYHEKTLGQQFCDKSSIEILNMLLKNCEQHGVQIMTNCSILNISQSPEDKTFTVKAKTGIFSCRSLVVATGGLSIPEMGASGFGYELARQFDIRVTETSPALVGLRFKTLEQKLFLELAGISFKAVVSCDDISFTEAILFTHKGLSGPAILQSSSYWEKGKAIRINMLPDHNIAECIARWKVDRPRANLQTLLSEYLPKGLVQFWLEHFAINKPVIQYEHKEIKHLEILFHEWKPDFECSEGYRKAEVTKGGVDTNELSSKTFESKKVPGLYFIGEVVDVTGWLGGYNFQWAWASGYCSGLYV